MATRKTTMKRRTRTAAGTASYANRTPDRRYYGQEYSRRTSREHSYSYDYADPYEYEYEYAYGTAARQLSPAENPYRREEARRNREQAAVMAARKNREKASHMNAGYLLFMLLVVGALFVVLVNYIRIDSDVRSTGKTIASLESQLETVKAANEERKNKIDSSYNLDEIKYTAVTKLGMKYADQDQIHKYVNESADGVRYYLTQTDGN